MIKKMATAALLATLTVPAIAQAPVRNELVQFARGTSSKVIAGSIKGDQIVDYSVGARAGQTMTVSLTTSNASNYFNITAPGAEAALFIGSSEGNRTSFKIPSSGNYTVRVYLMRNAARRNEVAKYKLTVGVK